MDYHILKFLDPSATNIARTGPWARTNKHKDVIMIEQLQP